MVLGIGEDIIEKQMFDKFVKTERSGNYILCRVSPLARSAESVTEIYKLRNEFYEGDVRVSFTHTKQPEIAILAQQSQLETSSNQE